MSVRGPRLEFAVGAFLLLALASLLVLALASTNGKFGFGAHSYPLKARFTNLGQLRTSAPVKIGGGLLGESNIGLQPGGDPESLKPGEEIAFTTPAVDLIQMVGKYMFGGGGNPASADAGTAPQTQATPTESKP